MHKLLVPSIFSIVFLLVSCSGDGDKKESGAAPAQEVAKPAVPEKPNKIRYLNAGRIFRDDNDKHLSAVEKIGIKPLASRDGIKNASRELKLVGGAMRFGESYVVDKLTHSSPFLVPEAAKLLQDIGTAFHDSLRNKHLPQYSIIVTSLLRTDADVKSLSRTNINASKRSVHCYGTTFDLAYFRFEKAQPSREYMHQDNLKLVLGQVLLNEQRAGNIYVKYEKKQACFHITVRK
jgi:hypothetical protein